MATRKRGASPILRPKQERYLRSLLPPRDALAREIESYAAEHDVPIAQVELARLLEALAASRPSGRCLEVGTAIGYGTLALARGAGIKCRCWWVAASPRRCWGLWC